MNPTLPLLALALAAAPAPTRQVVDRVAAVVNGDVITLRELRERAGEEWRRVERLDPGPARDQAGGEVLRRAYQVVLAEKLFRAQARELGIEITDAQVDGAIESIKRQNNFDDRQLDQALVEAGLDRARFREQVRRDLESYQILNYKVRSKVKVSDEDVLNYYRSHPREFEGEEEVHVRHVFLPLPEDASPAEVARAEAEGQRALQRIAAGEDFAKVAREVSKGPGAEDGGDLGWLRRGTIQKALEDVAFALETGQVSRVVRAGPGLHILKAEGRRTGGGRPFEQVKDEIRDRLTVEQTQTYREQYLAELTRDAVIEVTLPELR